MHKTGINNTKQTTNLLTIGILFISWEKMKNRVGLGGIRNDTEQTTQDILSDSLTIRVFIKQLDT